MWGCATQLSAELLFNVYRRDNTLAEFLLNAVLKKRCFVHFRSNLLGTQFTLFDKGDNPKQGMDSARKELIGVVYVSI